ncbi:MAG: glycosyltransferase [Verrucomicrobiae bacterium]|nr:glycosyltransferase [Verrucomicrobiae bacterium]
MVSIIIPLKKDQGYLQPCVEACFGQYGVEMEVIVLPDEPEEVVDSRVIQEATGPVSPARKRNRGAELAKGEILAFIDDDTRPVEGWLEAALPHFNDPKVAAVGGPSITPRIDPFWAQVSGAVYESWMMSGNAVHRYRPGVACCVDDYPSCNLLVRRTAFKMVNGFGTDFWPGEDTEFCLALVKAGFRICYEPTAVIEHHRRPSLRKHFIQLANYGLHRGYFAKRYPETSRRLPYFLPSTLVVGGTGLLALVLLGPTPFQWVFEFLAILYFMLAAASLAEKPFRLILPAVCVIFASHVVYGVAFLRGLAAARLPEEKASVAGSPCR